jgi:hypothetical protein
MTNEWPAQTHGSTARGGRLPRKHGHVVIWFWLVLQACAAKTWGFSIVDNSTGPVMAMNPWCKSVLDPVPVAPLAAGGADAAGQRATILADFPGIPPGQIVLGAAAPGTLTIDDYFAWVRGDAGGAHLTARYDDGDGVSDWTLPGGANPSYRWIQEINTNKPLGGPGAPYIDPRPGDDVKQGALLELPYYWTDPEAIGRFTNGPAANPFDLKFSDTPSRPCNMFVNWEADLFIVTENRFTYPQLDPLHVITIHDGIRWGFELTPKQQKISRVRMSDTILTTVPIPTVWGPGIAETQQFGTNTIGQLHAGGVVTTVAGQTITDALETSIPMNFGLLRNYTFEALIEGPRSSQQQVFINALDEYVSPLAGPGMMEFNVNVPIFFHPLGADLSVTIHMGKDLLVIVDESMASTQRSNPAALLYVGSYREFDPISIGLQVVGQRSLNFNVIGITGDFDGNGVYDCGDINALTAAVASGIPNPTFDLNGDNVLSLSDVDAWRLEAGNVNIGPGRPYLIGDANLDTVVDGSDFNLWNANKFTMGTDWCSGNFNADNGIDGSDFNLWNANKFQASDGITLVPEPISAHLIGMVVLVWVWSLRRKTQ